MKKQTLMILLFLILIIGGLLFGPVLGNLRQNLKVGTELKNTNQVLTTKLTTLTGIERSLVNSRVQKMELVFPSQKPIVSLLSTLSQLSNKNGLSFGGVSLQPGSLKTTKVKTAGLSDLKFGFEVTGNFAAILQFMQELERAAPLMRIDKVGLTIKSTPLFTTQETIVSANIEVSAFYQAAPETIGAITKPVTLLNQADEAILTTLFTFIQFPTVLPIAETGKADLFQIGL